MIIVSRHRRRFKRVEFEPAICRPRILPSRSAAEAGIKAPPRQGPSSSTNSIISCHNSSTVEIRTSQKNLFSKPWYRNTELLMKKKEKDLSDVRQHPPARAGTKPRRSGRARSSPPVERPAHRHHSWAPRIGSSARLESVARVENTVVDVYYRNDSICEVVNSLHACWGKCMGRN